MKKFHAQLHLPPIGARIAKSGAAVLLCFAVYQLSPRNGILFYMALASLQCIQPEHTSSRAIAKQRISGTFIGAAYGLLTILFQYYLLDLLPFSYFFYCIFVAVFVMASLYTAAILKFQSAAYFSCVVYLSITLVHIGDDNPYLFVYNRVLDTLIGILIGIVVNNFHLPYKKDKETLFAAGLDDVLLSGGSPISAFNRIELNRMLEEGLAFTIMTMRTPASFLEAVNGIRLQLPVILMDGAAIYNVKENTYPYKCEMSYEEACSITETLRESGLESFQNVIHNDNVFIYFQNLANEGSRQLYETLRRSPYRNYINLPLPEHVPVVYIMAFDKTDKIADAYQKMQAAGFAQRFKIVCYESHDYPGYSYLKIYHRNASRQTALEQLKQMTGFGHTYTFGTVPGMYDELVTNLDADDVVRLLKRKYETPIFRKV
ncbi:MAG: HAD hydrolase family protein [Lachnoclostridium sp.]|nr:HAD hydrolase family protein [Lachnospira sp.]MCM1248579.1 HAD hydrolase family protein [Lachnoclostridium sp.]